MIERISSFPKILSLDPSFLARARCLQEYAGIKPAGTRSKPGPYIFGRCARTSAKCSTVSACDRKLREPRTRDLRGFVTEIFGAPGFPNVETTIVSLASRTPHLQISPSSRCLRVVFSPSSSLLFRSIPSAIAAYGTCPNF